MIIVDSSLGASIFFLGTACVVTFTSGGEAQRKSSAAAIGFPYLFHHPRDIILDLGSEEVGEIQEVKGFAFRRFYRTDFQGTRIQTDGISVGTPVHELVQ